MKILHISDLHFHGFPSTQHEWSAKRLLGSMNLIVRRQRYYPLSQAVSLVQCLQQKSYDHLVVTGDLTSLGLRSEFQQAREVCEPLFKNPQRVTVLPGNHDRYSPDKSIPDSFYEFFGDFFLPGQIPDWSEGTIKTQQLTEIWHLIGWDSTHPNPLFCDSGTISLATLRATEAYISLQAHGSQFIIANHYPVFFTEAFAPHRGHELHNRVYLESWIRQQPQVKLYLHGHVHQNWHWIMERPGSPLHVINSASSTKKPLPQKTSAFHEIHLEGREWTVLPQQIS